MRRGISFRLTVLVLACSSLIFCIILGYNYIISRGIIVRMAEEKGDYLASNTGQRLAEVFSSVSTVVDDMAQSLENGVLTEERVRRMGGQVLRNHPEIFGTAIGFEAYRFDPYRKYFAPYHYRMNGGVVSTILGGDGYQYFYMDWYQLPRELGESIWTEPYFDEGGGGALITTYSAPFYREENGQRRLVGVVTAHISRGWLQDLVSGIDVCDTGYGFLLSRYGAYISHPDSDLIMNETIFSRAEELGLPDLRELGRRMRKGDKGFVELAGFQGLESVFVYYLPLPMQHWSFGLVFPKAELFADVSRLSSVMSGMGIAGIGVLAGLILLLSRTITRPLRLLTTAAREIASGNLDLQLPEVSSRDEVGELAGSFQTMRTSLKSYIADLTETTAAKERIESELSIAREIQMGILPKLFPAFPERSEFDIFASIEPAREVGGDLYDFFFVDDNHFCFLVGDVSGKGVPAALFMAVTKTLLKVVAETGLEPGEVLAKVNDDLAEENDSCMFVTLFLAVLDVRNGEVRYANAGHNPPLYVQAAGAVEWVPSACEPMAGAMEGMTYSTGTMHFSPGDRLFIYTDGVTEAMNRDSDLYTEERLLEDIAAHPQASAAEIIREVDAGIKTFTAGAEQSDDITMLAMTYLGTTSAK